MPGWQNDTLLFAIAALAVIPLAGWLGRATEQLAERAGPGVGGLLNATFGNAAELIIGLLALSHGLIGVVKASITGSIIGNILLVLGASMLAGGFRFSRQRFNQTAAWVSSTSLTLAAIGLIIPTIFHLAADQQPGGWSPQAEQRLSVAIAAVLFVTYVLSLVFSLVTHKDLFAGDAPAAGQRKVLSVDIEPVMRVFHRWPRPTAGLLRHAEDHVGDAYLGESGNVMDEFPAQYLGIKSL